MIHYKLNLTFVSFFLLKSAFAQNAEIPFWIIDNSVLIDETNKIRMVGFPFSSDKKIKEFELICSEE